MVERVLIRQLYGRDPLYSLLLTFGLAVVLSEAAQQHYRRELPFQDLMAEIGRRTERDLSIGELIAFLGEHL